MKTLLYILFFVISGIFVSCDRKKATSPEKATATEKRIKGSLTIQEFDQRLNSDPNVQLLDVRTPEEFAEGHIKGAINYNIDSPDFNANIATLDKNKPVLTYCRSGRRSSAAADILYDKGFVEVYNMEGGILEWIAAGKPIEKDKSAADTEGLTMEAFSKLVESDKMVLVDFNAQWCGPCKFISPMLDRIANEKKDKVVLLKIDADKNSDLLTQKRIDAIPYLELYKNGKMIWSHMGIITEEQLLKETGL